MKQYDINDTNTALDPNPAAGQTNDVVNDLFPNDDDNYLDQSEGGNQSKRFDSMRIRSCHPRVGTKYLRD